MKRKKAGVAILTSEKTDCRTRDNIWDTEGHDVSHQEDVTVLNVHAPNRAHNT